MTSITFDYMQDKLISLAEFGVRKALSKGAEGTETFISMADTISIIIKKSLIEARRGVASGVGVRIILGKKVGFAATSGITKPQIEATIDEALQVAKIRPQDPDFKHLPDPIPRPSKDGVLDDAVIGFSEEDALRDVNILAETAFAYDRRIKSLFGDVEVGRRIYAVANSRGISDSAKGASIAGGVYCIAAEEGKQKTGSEMIVSRKLEDFSEIGEKAAERAIKMLEARP